MTYKVITAQECIRTLNERSASLFLALLLCGDLAFVVLHLINGLKPLIEMPLLRLGRDGGYPELYQYLKFLWIIIILILVSLKNASFLYVAWAAVFAYFLVDGSIQIHERVGTYVAANLSRVPTLGLRLQDFGELAVSAAAGIILFVPLVWAYRNGSRMFRKVSQDFALLISLLIFFGVVVDMAHSTVRPGRTVGFVVGVIEEGGEMLSVSFILWYAFLMMVRDRDSGCYLCDCARIVLTRRST